MCICNCGHWLKVLVREGRIHMNEAYQYSISKCDLRSIEKKVLISVHKSFFVNGGK